MRKKRNVPTSKKFRFVMVVPTLLLLLLLQENVVDAFFLVQPTTRKTETKRLQQQPLALFQMAAVSVPLGDDQDDENDKGDKRNENNNQQVSIAFTQERGGGGGGSSMTLVVIQKWYTKYLRAIDQRPLLTKGLTAAVVNVLGDILAQYLQASSSGVKLCLNWARLQTFFLCGWIYIGPYVHTWYEQLWKLGKWMETRWGSPKQVQTIAQILVDQTLGVALFFSTYFYVYEVMDALVNRRLPVMSTATAKIFDNLGSVILTNYKLWPLVNWISFTFCPVPLRVLLNNVVGVLWNAFLCTKMAAGVAGGV